MKKKLLILGICLFTLASCHDKTVNPPVVSECVLNPEGGVYHLNGDVTLVVPQGAVDAETAIEISYTDNCDALGTEGKLTTDIFGMLTCKPEGLTFNKAIEVHMPACMPASDTTAIVLWNAEDKSWNLTDYGLTDGNDIVFNIEHFCYYAAIPQEYLTLFELFDRFINIYVSHGETSEAELNSACERFCKEYLDEALHMGEVSAPEYFEKGNPQKTCVGICGYFVHIIGQDSIGGPVYQGSALYKEKSGDGVIYQMTDRMMTEHLKDHIRTDSKQNTRVQMISLYAKPTNTDLTADVEKSSIERNQTTVVTVRTECGGSVLGNQKVTLKTDEHLVLEQEEVTTGEDGTARVNVRGVQAGLGKITAQTKSPADESLVSETEVQVNVTEPQKGMRFHADIEEEVRFRIARDLTGGTNSNDGKYCTVVIKSEMDYKFDDDYDFTETVTNARITDISVKYMPTLDTIIEITQTKKETYTSTTTLLHELPIALNYTNQEYQQNLTSPVRLMTLKTVAYDNVVAVDPIGGTKEEQTTWTTTLNCSIAMPYMLSDPQKEGTTVTNREYVSDPYYGILGMRLQYDGDKKGDYVLTINGTEQQTRTLPGAPDVDGNMAIKSTVTIKRIK